MTQSLKFICKVIIANLFLLVILALSGTFDAQAQEKITFTYVKTIDFDESTKRWGDWPEDYQEIKQEASWSIRKVKDGKFAVDMIINGNSILEIVDYAGKQKQANGVEITTYTTSNKSLEIWCNGPDLDFLSKYGFSNVNTTYIYMWVTPGKGETPYAVQLL